MLPVTRIRIVGPSMEPTLVNGDWWLVRRGASVGPGDVVLLVHPRRPDALVVKRIDHRADEGWWVLGVDADSSQVLFMKKVTLDLKAESKGQFLAPPKAGGYRFKLYLMCDSVLGADQEHEVAYSVLPGGGDDDEPAAADE